MSLVDCLTQLPRFRLTPISFVKISMCSYEKARQPSYPDLSFYNQDLGNRDEIFSYQHCDGTLLTNKLCFCNRVAEMA